MHNAPCRGAFSVVKRCTLTKTGQDFAAKIINVKGMSQRGEAGWQGGGAGQCNVTLPCLYYLCRED